MLDFMPMKQGARTMNALAADLSVDDLRVLTQESIAALETLLKGMEDTDVRFVPADPEAADAAAADLGDRYLPWTIGHNIVHMTASAEEYAATATELARGVPFHARPRYETPWQTITTVDQCRQRLLESRRIRLASLDMWPDEPHLDTGYIAWDTSGLVNATGIFVWGLAHDADHLQQMAKILDQAKSAALR